MGYGKSPNNSTQIKLLTNEFTVFKYPLLDVLEKNATKIWPANESFTLMIDIINHGPMIDYAELSLELSDHFEPICSTERVITKLGSLKQISFAFQVIPRVDGYYNNYYSIKVKSKNYDEYDLSFMPNNINILPNIKKDAYKKNLLDNNQLSILVAKSQGTKYSCEINKLPRLMEIDCKSCLNKMRVIAEHICCEIINKKNLEIQNKDLNKLICLIQQHKILSSRCIGYLHTIRVVGNLASHHNIEEITVDDVRLVSYALAIVISEIIN